MELLVLAGIALLINGVSVFSVTKILQREFARERRELIRQNESLLDRLMFLSGKPWVTPPREEFSPSPPVEDEDKPPDSWKEF